MARNDPPTIRVPKETPFFNEDPRVMLRDTEGDEQNPDPEQAGQTLTISRTWIIFFERMFRRAFDKPFHRTLLLKDTTVGNDIADHVPAYAKGKAKRVIGLLRKAIASNLTVRIKVAGVSMGTFTIPSTTAVDTAVEFSTFTSDPFAILDKQAFSFDITASDGQQDKNGVASFTVQWL